MKKFCVVKLDKGSYTIGIKSIFGCRALILHDTHPGHGGSIVTKFCSSKSDCEKAVHWLQRNQLVKHRDIHWSILEKIECETETKFMYYKYN
jgi:hypothetical protein